MPIRATLEKSKIDFTLPQTQMLFGSLALLYVCILQSPRLETATLFVGSLPENAIAHPAVWLALTMIGQSAAAQHVFAVCMLFACSLLVSLITLELTGPAGNRLGACPALWAGLLFAVHPLHAGMIVTDEATLGAMMATLFSLASVFSFLRFLFLRERPYYFLSLGFCALALFSGHEALVLPAVLCIFAAMVASNYCSITNQKYASAAMPWLIPHWAILTGCMMFGGSIFKLDVPITGITAITKNGSLVQLLAGCDFSDAASPSMQLIAFAIAAAIALSFLARLIPKEPLCPAAVPIAFALWILFALVATPDDALYRAGFASTFMATAPVCILISLSALPALDTVGRDTLRKWCIAGTLALFILFSWWSFQHNVYVENMQQLVPTTGQAEPQPWAMSGIACAPSVIQ